MTPDEKSRRDRCLTSDLAEHTIKAFYGQLEGMASRGPNDDDKITLALQIAHQIE